MMKSSRGILVAVEGLDKAGKSTQCQRLVKQFKEKKVEAELIIFPDRSTATGKLISSYLSNSDVVLPDQSIHLLFSANRWETATRITTLLESGTHVILDRYIPSGLVFSLAKEPRPFDMTWAMAPEVGLPAPDLVIFLDIDEEAAAARGAGYGEERYEKKSFQRRAKQLFLDLQPTWIKYIGKWITLDAAQDLDQVSAIITDLVQQAIASASPEISRIKSDFH